MTDFSWVNTEGGDWSESANWNNGVPSTSDASVTIGIGGTYTVSIDADEGFAVDSVTLDNAHATLAVAGTLTLGGGFDIAAGKITGDGFLFVGGGSIGGGTVSVANQSIGGTVTLSSALTDTGTVALGSSASDTLALGAHTLKLTGTGSTVAGTLTGTGMLALAGGSQAVNGGASLGMSKLAMSGSDGLTINTSLTYAGALTQAAGTALTVAGGNALTLTGTATLSGSVSGAVHVNAGKLVLDTTGNGAKLALSGGSVSVVRNLTYAGTLADTGGAMMLAGKTLTVMGATNLTNVTVMTAGTLSTKGTTAMAGVALKAGASLSNFGNATDSGIITLGDATTASLFVNNAGATLTLTNGMAVAGTVGSARPGGKGVGADAVTKPGSILRNNGRMMAAHGGGRGGVRVVGPNATTDHTVQIKVTFQNSSTGTVAVQSGTLEFDGSFTNADTKAGAISVAAGATLDLRGGGTSSAGAFKVTAGGALDFSGGTFTLTAGTLHGIIALNGGTLAFGANAVTIAGKFTQAGGSGFDGTGNVTLAGGARFAGGAGTIRQTGAGRTLVQGSTTVTADVALDGGRILENEGTLLWTAGDFELGRNPGGVSVGGARLRNDTGATFVIAGDGVIGSYLGTNALINAGTLVKSTSTGSATIAATFLNQGVVSVTRGTLELAGMVFGAGGSFKIGNGSTLEADAALPKTQALTFGTGGGTLVLNDAAEYGATIAGFGAHTAIDVTGFKFSGKPKASFVEAASKKQGVLTLTDGSQSLKITLFGQYVAAGFHLAAGSGGGTVVTYVRPTAHIVLAAGH